MWLWIILALIVIAGLVYWQKSRKKEEEPDISATTETSEAPQSEAPQSSESSREAESSESSSDEKKPM
jgi:cytoskeletal protein RodZ